MTVQSQTTFNLAHGLTQNQWYSMSRACTLIDRLGRNWHVTDVSKRTDLGRITVTFESDHTVNVELTFNRGVCMVDPTVYSQVKAIALQEMPSNNPKAQPKIHKMGSKTLKDGTIISIAA